MLGKFKNWVKKLPTWKAGLVVLGLICAALIFALVWIVLCFLSGWVALLTVLCIVYYIICDVIRAGRSKRW